MTIFEPCCEYDNPRAYPHNTTEECSLSMVKDGRGCEAPGDHHPYHRTINLHRGEWTYIVTDHHENWIDATSDVVHAFRIARKWIDTEGKTKVRKGLAYGFVVYNENEHETVTIVPTPRYTR
jgi:hypothetical protein